jgi:hypothetical protein
VRPLAQPGAAGEVLAAAELPRGGDHLSVGFGAIGVWGVPRRRCVPRLGLP